MAAGLFEASVNVRLKIAPLVVQMPLVFFPLAGEDLFQALLVQFQGGRL